MPDSFIPRKACKVYESEYFQTPAVQIQSLTCLLSQWSHPPVCSFVAKVEWWIVSSA